MSANLLYSDVEDSLRSSVRDLLAAQCPPEAVTGAYETDRPDYSGVWRALAAEVGVAALLVPEDLGGAGATARETATVLEELGRAVTPVPFLSSAVLATVALAGAGDRELLPRLADGTLTATLVVPLSTAPGAAAPAVETSGDGLAGSVSSVPVDPLDDVLVVPVRGPAGTELHTVRRDAPGLTVTPVVSLDMTRPLADVRLEGAGSTRVGDGDAAGAVDAALLCGAALLASEQVGVARWCLETTVAYLKQRTQFGRPLGSYQAIKHRLAELWAEIGSANAVARYAADCVAQGSDDVPTAAAVAQAYCSDVAVHAAEEAVQLHGGIGMTWEHPAHLYLKRAKADQIALGTPDRHRTTLAGLVDLPAPSAR
ncbi:MAG: acyl-CoA dehydrogenase family protein [Nocardioidaceae bacterium]